MTADSFLALQTAIAGVIANACADPNDGIAWAAERDVHMLTASQIIDDFLDPEVDAAEKRGAAKATAETIMGGQRYVVVWALRRAAEDWRAFAIPGDEDDVDFVVARSLDARADRIQAGGDR